MICSSTNLKLIKELGILSQHQIFLNFQFPVIAMVFLANQCIFLNNQVKEYHSTHGIGTKCTRLLNQDSTNPICWPFHNDVTEANIHVSGFGKVSLIDFGLSEYPSSEEHIKNDTKSLKRIFGSISMIMTHKATQPNKKVKSD